VHDLVLIVDSDDLLLRGLRISDVKLHHG
jgi:hypothetical protein